jgi:hypothetical protein
MRTSHKDKNNKHPARDSRQSWLKPYLVESVNTSNEPVFYPLCLEPVPGTKFPDSDFHRSESSLAILRGRTMTDVQITEKQRMNEKIFGIEQDEETKRSFTKYQPCLLRRNAHHQHSYRKMNRYGTATGNPGINDFYDNTRQTSHHNSDNCCHNHGSNNCCSPRIDYTPAGKRSKYPIRDYFQGTGIRRPEYLLRSGNLFDRYAQADGFRSQIQEV